MLRKILCPTDFSVAARNAVRAAASLANQHDAELVLLHAWFVPTSSYAGTFVLPSDVVTSVREGAAHALSTAAREAVRAGARKVTTRLVRGIPDVVIVDTLADEAFDLCVIGTHGRSGVPRLLAGSVAEKVLRHASTPVLTIRPDIPSGHHRHVLCPTDFSQTADAALELARDLVRPGGALTLVHVFSQPPGTYGLTAQFEAEARQALETRATRIGDALEVHTRLLYGHPASEIVRVLEQDPSIDLIAMGSRRRSGLARLVIGSVAEEVLRSARAPVLITGDPDRDAGRAAS
jgi:nucleotide-binding universal stress UspA family protein